MSSKQRGIGTSGVEVSGISAHGVWLLAGNEGNFLSYEDFPWLKDVSVETIRHPDRFPLRARVDT